jgi:hypothetical protein
MQVAATSTILTEILSWISSVCLCEYNILYYSFINTFSPDKTPQTHKRQCRIQRIQKASFQTDSPLRRVAQKRGFRMVKMNGSTDYNEAHTSCVEHTHACVQERLFSLVDSLHRKIFLRFESYKLALIFVHPYYPLFQSSEWRYSWIRQIHRMAIRFSTIKSGRLSCLEQTYPLKTEFVLHNIYKFSPYLTGNTLCLRYEDQPVNAV